MALLVLVVGGAICVSAYLVARQTLENHASVRLTHLQAQFLDAYRRTIASSRAVFGAASARPALRAYLDQPTTENEPSARAAMQAPAPLPEWVVAVELRDVDGKVLLRAPGHPDRANEHYAAIANFDGASLIALTAQDSSGVGYGRLLADGDVALFPIVATIGRPARGYLVTWRRTAPNTAASQAVSSLMGAGSVNYLVNADGSVWSANGKSVPPGTLRADSGHVERYEREGTGTVLSVSGLLERTPWAFVFEYPVAVAHAPAITFFRNLVWIALLLILPGMLLVWHMSRRLAKPLHELTVAADGIAAGELSRRASFAASDELGGLVTSFNAMAAEIEASRTRLESLVAERTQRLREAEDALVRREKLALVGQFAGSVSHEIRNPLSVIANTLHLMEAQAGASPELRKHLEVIGRQVELSTKIINDMLDLSRATPPTRQRVQVESFLVPSLAVLATSDVTVEFDIPAGLPMVETDPVQAAQVVDNLLRNAVQAVEGGGQVQVTVVHECDVVAIEIADSGPGITAEHRARVFEPLFTTKARGVGLGLPLSRSIANANGGDLELVSSPGEGARFRFTLPVAPVA